ncbi:MAG TPA: DCC1-like thiol-disulfide oxidoreductase family protein [Chloroflexota bacterium]
MHWIRVRDRAGRVLALPSQTRGLVERYGLSRSQTDRELWVVDREGRAWPGAAGVNRVFAELGPFWARVAGVYRFAPIRRIEDRAYRWVAEHRSRFRFWSTTPECEQRPGTCD